MNLIEQHIKPISDLCQLHKVERLFVFGSITSNLCNAESDVDFLVKFKAVDPHLYFDNYMAFKESLESLLHRPVDLVEEQTIKNPVLKNSIDKSKKLIYCNENLELSGMFLAAQQYEKGELSLGQAAELAGCSKCTFMESLGQFGVSVFNYPVKDLDNDILNAKTNTD